jgi:Tat protein translocase TatC
MATEEETFRRMTISEHLDELRGRVIRALIYLGLGLVVVLIFNDRVMQFILDQPVQVLKDLGYEDPKFQALNPTEGFVVWLKLALIVAIVVASPLMAREVWGFVAAGLYPHEKKYVRLFAPLSYLLFLGGVAFLYYFVLPTALNFLFSFLDPSVLPVRQDPRISEYLSFYIVMSLLMGLVFQLPLVMLFFMAIGMIRPATFRKYRRHFIVGAVTVMAVVSPTGDAPTLILISAPVVALYEIGILLGAFVGKGKRERS